MSKYGYVGKESDIPQQAFKANAGVLSVNDHLALSQENKLTQYGQLELLSTQTFTGVQEVDFTNIDTSYNVHFVTWTDQRIEDTTNTRQFQLQLFESGVLETASVYQQAIQTGLSSGTFSEVRSGAINALQIGGQTNNTATDNSNGYFYMYNAGDSTKYTFITAHSTRQRDSNFVMTFGSGILPQTSVVDGFRFEQPQSNTIQGQISLYGIRYS